AAGERAHAGAAVALDVVADQPQLGEPPHQGPGQLGPLPVLVDRREHLVVDEAPRGDELRRLLVAELLAHEEVVGGERLPEVLVRKRLRGHGADASRSFGRGRPRAGRPAGAGRITATGWSPG